VTATSRRACWPSSAAGRDRPTLCGDAARAVPQACPGARDGAPGSTAPSGRPVAAARAMDVVGRPVQRLGGDRGHVGVDVQLAEGPGHRHAVVPVADVVATADLVDVDRWERRAASARLGEADPTVARHGERGTEPSVERAVDPIDGAHDPVDRDGGHTAKVADACVVVPTVNPATVTPHSEAFQAVVWHLFVSHPKLKVNKTKWEGTR